MASKGINYLARTFDSIKDELIKFSNEYYPEVADSFNDSSVGAWFIDLMAAVGDDLSFHTDRCFQETNINTANKLSSVMNLARENGLKVPGLKSSMCEVELSCRLPLNSNNPSLPDWNYAPIVQRASTVAAGDYVFEISESVDFKEQFNKNGFSNRRFEPVRGHDGNITGYTVTKSVIAVNGTTRVYKKVLSYNDLSPFMEIVLPEVNVMNVESIIFKDTSNYALTPQIEEYYIDEEEYRVKNEAVTTYRYFECDSLVDQYRFGTDTKLNEKLVEDLYDSEEYADYTETPSETSQGDGGQTLSSTRTTRYYKGSWKPLKQKFITEFTDNGYLKIIFGSGNGYGDVPSGYTKFSEYQAAKLINNDMLGVLPKEGWTMFILYRVGGGMYTNLAPQSINEIVQARVDWHKADLDGTQKGAVLSSLKVTNTSTAIGGKDRPSVDEIRNLIKYNTASQNRAVTVQDYKAKIMSMPPKFGAPFRTSVIETNNKVEINFLGLNALGKLDSSLPQTFVENAIEYMSHYKQINDYIEMRSGKIYNIGVALDVFIDKNYNSANVISNVINCVREYFDVTKHEMGEDIFIGDLMKEINMLDGVLSLIELRIYAISNGEYSLDVCPLPRYTDRGTSCDTASRPTLTASDDSAIVEELDLEAMDGVLSSDYNSMFEIYKQNDIQVRAKLK